MAFGISFNIEADLQRLINEYPESMTDWRSLIIKNKGIIEDSFKYKYRIGKGGEKIALARSIAAKWKRHDELYSYALFKLKLEGKLFLPFTKVKYCTVASWYSLRNYAEPYAAISQWSYKDYYCFSIKISKSNDCFSLCFCDNNNNQIQEILIPGKIREILKAANFEGNTWKCKIDEDFTFDKIMEKLNELTSKC
jgi:hypothetical protein